MISDGERTLWCAVINQAIEDATHPTKCEARDREAIRNNARDWLLKPNEDFEVTCALAGLEPDRVRATARRDIERAASEKREPKHRGRQPKLIENDGRSMSVAEWANEAGISVETLRSRLAQGWPLEHALTKRRLRRGVVSDFDDPDRDRRGSVTQESAQIEFSEPAE